MTKPEFVNAHFDEIYGMVCDAMISRNNDTKLSMEMRLKAQRTREILNKMYDELVPPGPVEPVKPLPQPPQPRPK